MAWVSLDLDPKATLSFSIPLGEYTRRLRLPTLMFFVLFRTSGFPKAVLSTQRMALSNAISGMVGMYRSHLNTT